MRLRVRQTLTENKRNKEKRREVIVTFVSVSLRDAVRAGAYNLGQGYGMRIHVPDFLKANFRHLDGVCYDLKQKFPSLKRNIKFDDELMDLYADVLLSPGSSWKKILPSEARVSRNKGKFVPDATCLTADVLDELLEQEQSGGDVSGANAVPIGRPAT